MGARKSGDERRSEIVEAAVEIADRLGPDRLTTGGIAAALGLSQAAVFKHFPSKQAIWEAIVGWIAGQLERCWRAAEASGGGAEERLLAIVRQHLRLVGTTPAIPSIVFSRELHVRNETLRKGLYALMGRFHRHIAQIIADGRASGEFRADLDPAQAAFLVIGMIQGLVIRWSLSGRQIDLVAEGDAMLTILMRGFR